MNAKWARVKKVCEDKGLTVARRGSEIIIKGPGVNDQFRCVRIGHKCCSGPNADVWGDYLNALNRAFGLKNSDFRKR